MKLSKKHKAYGVVAVVAIAGLAVDRFFLSDSGASTAQAATVHAAPGGVTANTSAPALAPTPAAVTEAAAQNSGPVIAARLEQMAALERLDPAASENAFEAGKLWRGKETASTPATPSEAQQVITAYQNQHKLKAVLVLPDGGIAVIDGCKFQENGKEVIGERSVKVGQVVDGFTLVKVRNQSVTLANGDVQFELSLQNLSMQK